jgi:hypothetical protein
MRYLKPWTTLGIGILIGWKGVPLLMAKVGK